MPTPPRARASRGRRSEPIHGLHPPSTVLLSLRSIPRASLADSKCRRALPSPPRSTTVLPFRDKPTPGPTIAARVHAERPRRRNTLNISPSPRSAHVSSTVKRHAIAPKAQPTQPGHPSIAPKLMPQSSHGTPERERRNITRGSLLAAISIGQWQASDRAFGLAGVRWGAVLRLHFTAAPRFWRKRPGLRSENRFVEHIARTCNEGTLRDGGALHGMFRTQRCSLDGRLQGAKELGRHCLHGVGDESRFPPSGRLHGAFLLVLRDQLGRTLTQGFPGSGRARWACL